MRVTFLGTSAANAFPEAFCRCENCTNARALGGPSLRKRSSALVNEDLLIDLGPDVMAASNQHGVPLTSVRYCLQTHGHDDHLDTSHFLSRSPGYGVVGAPLLHFYASGGTLRTAARRLEADCAPLSFLHPDMRRHLNVQLHQVEPFENFSVGRYRVTALPASHDPAGGSLIHAIEVEGCGLLYATDTAVFKEEVWQAFYRGILRFDVVILDHTYGPAENGSDHMSARDVAETVARLRAEALLKPRGRAFATHIAHEGNPPHPELVAFAEEHGYEVAYDGLTVEC
jgi:phosphoribosyl 1,2-cyclic phosphate phosphodiesterase